MVGNNVETSGPSGSPPWSLRFVEIADCKFQEAFDPRRLQATLRLIQAEGILRHPISACLLNDRSWTCWDGVNRTLSLQQLGLQKVLIQHIPAAEVSASTWVLEITDGSLECLRRVDRSGLSVATCMRELDDLAHPGTVCVAQGSSKSYLITRPSTIPRVAATRIVTDAMVAATSHAIRRRDEAIRECVQTDGLAFRFSRLTPTEVLEALDRGEQVGSGVTRFQFSRRVVGVNLPIWLLAKPTHELNLMLANIAINATVREYCDDIIQEVTVTWAA